MALEGGNHTVLGKVNGIVFDDRQLSEDEAKRAAAKLPPLRAVDSTQDTPTPGGTTMPEATAPDQVDFETEGLQDALNVVVKESKAGYKTTEFWVAIVVSTLTVVDGIPLPEKFEAFVVGGIAIAYAISRGLAKQGVPAVEPTPPAE